MMDFDFVSPTQIVFGKDAEKKAGALIESYGFSKIMLVHSGGSAVRSGLIDRVKEDLKQHNIAYVEVSGVRPNPEKDVVVKGLKLAHEEEIEMLLAVGGGSVIDTAKSIAVNFFYDGDPMDIHRKLAQPVAALPVGVILTIAAAGSELSNSAVLTDPAITVKSGLRSDLVRPIFALENPELTFGVPPYQTAAGIVDMMMHSMERYFNPSCPFQFSDDLALAICKSVYKAGVRAMEDPCDYDARGALMVLSGYAHNGITGLGKNNTFTVHGLEHILSAYNHDVTHGAGIAVCYLGWAKTYYKDPQLQKKLADFARFLFDLNIEDDEKAAIIGIDRMESFYKTIGMPVTLRELGFIESDLALLADLATGKGTRVVGACPQPLDREAVLRVYKECF